jgi:hypothetical protein
MSWSTGRAPVRIALLLAVLAAGAVMIRIRRGEVWHTLDDRDTDSNTVAGRSADEGP